MSTNIGKSAKYYMERRLPELQPTLRRPGPRIDRNAIQLPETNPPNPDALHNDPGLNPPDGPATVTWPYGEIVL